MKPLPFGNHFIVALVAAGTGVLVLPLALIAFLITQEQDRMQEIRDEVALCKTPDYCPRIAPEDARKRANELVMVCGLVASVNYQGAGKNTEEELLFGVSTANDAPFIAAYALIAPRAQTLIGKRVCLSGRIARKDGGYRTAKMRIVVPEQLSQPAPEGHINTGQP